MVLWLTRKIWAIFPLGPHIQLWSDFGLGQSQSGCIELDVQDGFFFIYMFGTCYGKAGITEGWPGISFSTHTIHPHSSLAFPHSVMVSGELDILYDN